ncbi:hypothetical protein [Verrucosispora sp. WMMC514]|uniref:hypothetical protein n=1 Tax=Verrucosispora sp. WMMC514 TaxID=3015156 RepID=UPI00248C8B00|nr:hypothetical protein [Verrucosispora sp. WMMC514]WBB91450.1 hypothetical protein O7597_31590 [Verrucosispora sp. WMMC514]WBB91481.1 hypothetical protein O7597_00045 [Verrucosispora sp. WMMC514]
MHEALVRDVLANERNQLALHEPEDWDLGPRRLVIAEELTAPIGQLVNVWTDVRGKGDPKRSPCRVGSGQPAWGHPTSAAYQAVPGDFLTLRQADEAGVTPWKLDAAEKRLQGSVGNVPTPRGKDGNADLYARSAPRALAR